MYEGDRSRKPTLVDYGFRLLLREFLKGIPRDLEDAARLDGCGFLRIYWHIMLPLVRPTLAVIAIFTFLATWNDFMGPLIYLMIMSLSPLLWPLRFPDSIPSARYQRWHWDANGRVAPDDAAGNRNLLLRPTLLSPRYYIDGNEGIIESLLHPRRNALFYRFDFDCRRYVVANAGNGFRSAIKH